MEDIYSEEEDTINLKVVVIGEVGVGKTSIIKQFISKSFSKNVPSSVSGQYCQKVFKLDDGKNIQFDIWDTAGEEKYRTLVKMFYQDASAAILVYDITRKETFDEIKNYWYKEITQTCPNIILIIDANKVDLIEEEKVDEKEARKFAEELNAIFCSSSAKENINIDEIFFKIGKKYFGNDNLKFSENNDKKDNLIVNGRDSIKLSKNDSVKKKKKKKFCCKN